MRLPIRTVTLLALAACLAVASTSVSGEDTSSGTGLSGLSMFDDSSRIIHSSEASVAQIVLSLSPDQVVGQPLLGTAQIVLLDSAGNQITDYDLAANPIQLVPERGQLIPDQLDDPALMSGGVIDFLPAQVLYHGRTGPTGITAVSGAISSTEVVVTFNGYDIADAFEADGSPIQIVYSRMLTTISVVVENNGDLVADQSPTLKSYFRSGGGSVKSFIVPQANGVQDTVVIDLPTENLAGGEDSLVLLLQSDYDIGAVVYTAFDSLIIPVTVLIPTLLDLVPGSFVPDSVYAGDEFDISFEVATSGFVGPIDGTSITIRLFGDTAEPALATIYEGTPEPESFQNDVITYSGLTALIDAAIGLVPGWYLVCLDYRLVSMGNVYGLDMRYPDSLHIVAPADLAYLGGTLSPTRVPVSTEVSFSFDLSLGENDNLEVDAGTASFTVAGQGFSTTVGLLVNGDSLVPGVNRIIADAVYIPSDQLGENLTLSASFQYRVPGAGNFLSFTTDFDGQTVLVEEVPLVQIIEVSAVSPNDHKVNTLQTFKIKCVIQNLSSVSIENLPLRMTTDGASSFDPDLILSNLDGNQSGEVFFDVTAAATPDDGEEFQIAINTAGINQEPPLDFVAIVAVQTPADLRLTWSLPGAESGFVDRGAMFGLVVDIHNDGQADVSPIHFRLTSHGVGLGIDDPLVDTIYVEEPYALTLTAPEEDTTIVITFELIDDPLDLNDSLPAEIDAVVFEDSIRVFRLGDGLVVAAQVISTNAVLPGGERALFALEISNTASPSDATVRLETLSLRLVDAIDQPINVRSILKVGNSGFYDENRIKVSTATAGGDRMVLTFPDFTLAVGDQSRLQFRTVIQEKASAEFRVDLEFDAIRAVFVGGPQAGQRVEIGSGGGTTALSETFTVAEGLSAENSFMIKDNPFNPTVESAEFQFYLPEPSQVELRLFTLTGEEVYERVYGMGELAAGDLVTLSWDGRNDNGSMVLNGVYVAFLHIASSGDEATLRIAVLK